MRSFFAFIGLTLALVACAPAGSPKSEFPTVAVDMRPGLFEPTTISIKKEQKVCWVNNDTVDRWPASNIHPTHEIYSEFDPQRGLDPGETWCFVFDKPGIWKFHDHLLPELVGTVTVEE